MRVKQEYLVLLIILLVGIISILVSTQFTGLATQQTKKPALPPELVAYKFYEQEEITFSPYECPFDFELTTKEQDIYSSPITGRFSQITGKATVGYYGIPSTHVNCDTVYDSTDSSYDIYSLEDSCKIPKDGQVVGCCELYSDTNYQGISVANTYRAIGNPECAYRNFNPPVNGQVLDFCSDKYAYKFSCETNRIINVEKQDCGSASKCNNGKCITTTGGMGTSCTSNNQCQSPLICNAVLGTPNFLKCINPTTPTTPTVPTPTGPVCGDITCNTNENPTNCLQDCSWDTCGNHFCDPGENRNNCWNDCSSLVNSRTSGSCGNYAVNVDEYCEAINNFGGSRFKYLVGYNGKQFQEPITCQNIGSFTGGTLDCTSDCLLDTGTCTTQLPLGGQCTTNTNCQAGLVCIGTTCSLPTINQQCNPAVGCLTGYVCNNNICSLPGLGQNCQSLGAGCSGNLLCQNNICIQPAPVISCLDSFEPTSQPTRLRYTLNFWDGANRVDPNNPTGTETYVMIRYYNNFNTFDETNVEWYIDGQKAEVDTVAPNQGSSLQPQNNPNSRQITLKLKNLPGGNHQLQLFTNIRETCTPKITVTIPQLPSPPPIACNTNNICNTNEDATDCPSDCDLGTSATFCTSSSSGVQLLFPGQSVSFQDSQGNAHNLELTSLDLTTRTAVIKYDGITMSLNLKQQATTTTYDILLALIGSSAQGDYARICANVPTAQQIIGCSHTFTNAQIYFWDGTSPSYSSQPTGTDTYVVLSYNGPDWDKYPDQKGVKWSIQGKEFKYTDPDPNNNNGWTAQTGYRMMTVKLTGLQPGQANLELQDDAGAFCRMKQVLIPSPTTPPPVLTCADIFNQYNANMAFFEQGQQIPNNAIKGPDSQAQVKLAGTNLGYTTNDFKFTVDGTPSGRITEVTEQGGFTYIKSDITFTQTPTLVAVTDSQGNKCSQDVPIAWTQRVAPALCGNGQLDPRELCDKGTANSNNPDAECRTDCRPRRCMDLICDANSGETKDTCPRDCAQFCDQSTPCADQTLSCTLNRCIPVCGADKILGNDLICRDKTTATKKPEAAKAPERKYVKRTFEELITYCPEIFQIPANKEFKVKFKTPTDPRVPEKLRRLIDPKLPLVVTCSGVTNVAEVIKVPGNVYENTFTLAVPATSCTFRVLKDKVVSYISPEYTEISTRTTSAEELVEIRNTEPPEAAPQPTTVQQPSTERPSTIPVPPLADETPTIETPTVVQEPIKIIGTPKSGKTIKIKITSTSQEPEIIVNLLSDASRYPKLITAKFKKKIDDKINEYETEITPYTKEEDLK